MDLQWEHRHSSKHLEQGNASAHVSVVAAKDSGQSSDDDSGSGGETGQNEGRPTVAVEFGDDQGGLVDEPVVSDQYLPLHFDFCDGNQCDDYDGQTICATDGASECIIEYTLVVENLSESEVTVYWSVAAGIVLDDDVTDDFDIDLTAI